MEGSVDDSHSIYSRHPVGLGEIRLIRLQPSSNLQDRIVTTMSVVPLDNAGQFHTISYAWGSDSSDEYIMCDNVRLPVRKNLNAGLKRIREKMAVCKEDRKRLEYFMPTIWVDSICVNQADQGERARQVPMMADIYTKAESVIAWLGEANDWEGANVLASLQGLKPKAEATATLHALAKRPYFKRRWIVQEITLAPFYYMLLGGTRLILDYVSFIIKELDSPELASVLGIFSAAKDRGRLPTKSTSGPIDYHHEDQVYSLASSGLNLKVQRSNIDRANDPASEQEVDRGLQGLSRRVDWLLRATQPLYRLSSIRTALFRNELREPASSEESSRSIAHGRSVSVPPIAARGLLKPLEKSRAATAAPYISAKAQNVPEGLTVLADGTQSDSTSQLSSTNFSYYPGLASNGNVSGRKRSNHNSDDDQQDASGRGPSLKRGRENSKNDTKGEGRFPCIFYAGEPERYPDDDKKYDHISQMQ